MNIRKNKLLNKKAFTLVELIVVITILAILGTIAFISLQGYSKQARDSRRTSDISNIKTSLELYSIQKGEYPLPDDGEEVSYSGDVLWTQGLVGDNVTINLSRNLTKKPIDPLFDIEYTYSLINNKKEYEVMGIFEGDLTSNNLLTNTYASTSYTPKVEGTYNEVFVKTSNYIVPTPSIVMSEDLPLDLKDNQEAINSLVINGGSNLPNLGISTISTKTGALGMTLSVYEGIITSDSTDEEKVAVVEKIQAAYDGTELSGQGVYRTILEKSGTGELLSVVDSVVLQNSTPLIEDSACDGIISGETKEFYDTEEVEAGQSCETHKQTFSCDNGIWYDGESLADTETYLYEGCVVADDIEAPIGGTFTINDNDATTNTTSVNLDIVCPTDVAGSTPIYIAYGTDTNPTNWITCTSDVSYTLTSGDGTKTVYMLFKDSLGNTTESINDSIVLSSIYGPTSLVLSHLSRSINFTIEWSAGAGNGDCKLQYYKDGTTWTDVSGTTYDCDSNLSNESVTLPGDGWYGGDWNGVQIRIIKVSDSSVLGTFSETLQCSSISRSSSSTPTIDEDCNGEWNNTQKITNTYSGCSTDRYCLDRKRRVEDFAGCTGTPNQDIQGYCGSLAESNQPKGTCVGGTSTYYIYYNPSVACSYSETITYYK